MSHLADQPQSGIARQPGVGIQREHITNARRHGRGRTVEGHERRIGRAAQQAIELVQLAALAFPAHPALLRGIEHPPAMQHQETRSTGGRPVSHVERLDRPCGACQQLGVARTFGLRAVDAVEQQGENEIAAARRQVMDLQPLDLLDQFVLAA